MNAQNSQVFFLIIRATQLIEAGERDRDELIARLYRPLSYPIEVVEKAVDKALETDRELKAMEAEFGPDFFEGDD